MLSFTEVRCKNCNKTFYRESGRFNEAIKKGWNQFCSPKCQFKFKTKKQILKCENCSKRIIRTPHAISIHNYCSHSCAAKAVNKNWADKRNGAILKCANCKKTFKKWLVGGNKKYCSKICQTNSELYTEKKLLKIIKDTAKKLDRVPARRELWGGADKACARLFGSWNRAVAVAGFTPNRSHDDRMYKRIVSKARDSHLCDSVSEVLIDNWLYKNKIPHKKDVRYPNTNHKADWSIILKNRKIFVEYFGLANDSPRYDRAIKEKQTLCKEQKIRLVSIYPKDLYPKVYLDSNLKNKFRDYLAK